MNKEELINLLKAQGFPYAIVEAFRKIPREKFVLKNLRDYAYDDTALPLEKGATISQPSTIAFMLKLLELEKGQKILEIGSGCGYVLALLNCITKGEIYCLEIIKNLADKSRKLLKNSKNIQIINQDGYKGLPSKAPFDRILVSCSFDSLPVHLYAQLKNKGILVVPVRNSIFKIVKENGEISKKEYPGFAFVPIMAKD